MKVARASKNIVLLFLLCQVKAGASRPKPASAFRAKQHFSVLSKRGIAFQPLQRHTTLFLQHTSPPHNCALFVVRSTHNPRTNHKQQQTKKVGEIIDESNPKLSALNHVANSPCRACPTPPKAGPFFFSIVTPALLFPHYHPSPMHSPSCIRK